jgi:hypothetical protein
MKILEALIDKKLVGLNHAIASVGSLMDFRARFTLDIVTSSPRFIRRIDSPSYLQCTSRSQDQYCSIDDSELFTTIQARR